MNKKKMKKYLLFGSLALIGILVILLLIFLLRKNSIGTTYKENTPEIDKLVDIEQSEVSSFVFVTQESENDHRLHISLTPFLTLNTDEKIQEFSIVNFKGTNKSNEVLLITPTDLPIDTVNRTFLFTVTDSIKMDDLISENSDIQYTVVSEVTKFNEVIDTGSITPYFSIIVKDLASIDYKSILDRDGIFDGLKYLEYSGISLDELNTEIQFDINIKFENGKKYMKRFSVNIVGDRFSSETSPLFPIEVVE